MSAIVSKEFKQAFAEWSRLLVATGQATDADVEENRAAIRADLRGDFCDSPYHIPDAKDREAYWLNWMLGEIRSMEGCTGAPGINERIKASIKKSKESEQCSPQ